MHATQFALVYGLQRPILRSIVRQHKPYLVVHEHMLRRNCVVQGLGQQSGAAAQVNADRLPPASGACGLGVRSRAAVDVAHIKGFIRPQITTHEHPSRAYRVYGLGGALRYWIP